MNKIRKLLDEQYVKNLLRRKVLPHYPAFKDIVRVEIRPYKELIWETTYHVVIGFNTFFVKENGEETKIPIVCSAHSDEPRENVYLALKYLWARNFETPTIDLPDPLFYSEYFNGTFYRGLKGENLLYYIKKKDFTTVENIVIAAAELYADLHALPATTEANFNPINSRIKTVIPGTAMIFREMKERYQGRYSSDLEKIYALFIEREEKFFAATPQLYFIHGDAHPENIIKTGAGRIGLIDFTDLCLSDFARDLGAFSQQLAYKITDKDGAEDYAAKIQKLFLDSYLAAAGLVLSPDLEARINLYYNWTAIRTATYWFLRHEAKPERGIALLAEVKKNLNLL